MTASGFRQFSRSTRTALPRVDASSRIPRLPVRTRQFCFVKTEYLVEEERGSSGGTEAPRPPRMADKGRQGTKGIEKQYRTVLHLLEDVLGQAHNTGVVKDEARQGTGIRQYVEV